MELAPGLHRIGNDLVAAYAIVEDSGVTLIDAGIPGQWRDLVAELRTLSRTPADIKGVVLTHGDSDHIGYAERLRSEYAVPLFIHPADAARARGEEKSSPSWGRMSPLPMVRFLGYTAVRGGLRPKYITEAASLEDGQQLQLPGKPVIIALPGHSPGSIAVHCPTVDAVCVGDGLTTRHVLTGVTGPQPAPFTDDPAQAQASLDRIAGLGVGWVLPGHGPAYEHGVAEAVRLVRAAASAG
jgi:glyoxylase-like metal-dependent hydrolase (beta-lactamase superfamily II)